ncbi:single-stranded DNA-binding protein [Pseudomonas sp. zfem003]|uniref:single-stranded DNA-binding protein n=1 Tax=Pseudomonas sp. zfem003 TaxID=3078198 RepID=UPI002928F7A1|nr:single-stranded DNA-binding protein [Pseudomonas sp. zfem003]MDU9399287.1 single-stranded DNA-binding protein [Pseudomonas sp. zfem003]
MSSKPKKEILFTPVGTVEPYAYLAKPDFGRDGFASERGKYKLSLTVPGKLAQPLVKKIVDLHEADYAARVAEFGEKKPELLKKLPRGKKLLEPYVGDLPFFENDDGTVTFKFASWASYEKEGELIPLVLKVVDAKGKAIQKVPNISGGSEGKARFTIVPYGWNATVGCSVKLQLEGFMLTKLVEFGGGEDDWGGQEEDGYEADESQGSSREEDQWAEDGDGQEPDDGDF